MRTKKEAEELRVWKEAVAAADEALKEYFEAEAHASSLTIKADEAWEAVRIRRKRFFRCDRVAQRLYDNSTWKLGESDES